MKHGDRDRRGLPVKTLIVCFTVIVLALIGSWVYVQKQRVEQKAQQAKMQQATDAKNAADSIKKLKYQECETTNRQAFANPTFASDLQVKNCDLIL